MKTYQKLLAIFMVAGPASCGFGSKAEVWYHDGKSVSLNTLNSYKGDNHCQYGGIKFLEMQWPLGDNGSVVRQLSRIERGKSIRWIRMKK